MKIDFVDLKREYRFTRSATKNAIERVLKKGNYILGDEVKAFEKEWAEYLGVRYAITVASGTDALFLAMKALGIGKGDEVIIPSYTFISTAFTVTNAGARPVFVDSKRENPTIDPEDIIKKISKRTKAIIPVHLFGNPANLDEIIQIAKKNKLFIIEDASQAHGAEYKGRKVGTFGDIGCFSFYPTKNLGSFGDSGAIITNSKKISDKLFLLRNYGEQKKYSFSRVGYNSRMDEIQAAILRVKLKNLDAWNNRRKDIAFIYDKQLTKMVLRLSVNKIVNPVHHLFPIFIKKRKKLQKYLASKGILTLIHYPVPVHLQKAYQDQYINKKNLRNSESLARQELSLPINPFLTNNEIKFVIKNINDFFS